MSEQPLISVIVPIYNVEKYLHKCVNSILNQTYQNLEIILVDDGSPDNSPAICDEFAKADNRVIVVHKANGGQSSARNAGLDICHGEYIGFVDSDDYIEHDMYETLFSLLEHRKNVVASTDILSEYDNDAIIHCDTHESESDTIQEYVRSCLLHKGDVSVCTKLFPHSLIANNRFDEEKLNEDLLFIFSLLNDLDSILYSRKIGYHYVYRNGSTTKQFGKAIHDMVSNAEFIFEFTNKNFPNLKKEAERFLIFQNLAFAWSIPVGYDRKSDALCQKSLIFLRRNVLKAVGNPYLTMSDKLRVVFVTCAPRLSIKLYNLIDKK